MFDGNVRTIQRVAAKVQRVMVVDSNPATARLLTEHLRPLGGVQIFPAPTAEKGYALARAADPQLIFVEHGSSGVDGLAFTRKLRRSDLTCREAPVIMCTSEATAEAIFGARDSRRARVHAQTLQSEGPGTTPRGGDAEAARMGRGRRLCRA